MNQRRLGPVYANVSQRHTWIDGESVQTNDDSRMDIQRWCKCSYLQVSLSWIDPTNYAGSAL